MNVIANSKRNRARLGFIEQHAIAEVKAALEAREISTFYAEQIAHLEAKQQPEALARIRTIRRRPIPGDKILAFPGRDEKLHADALIDRAVAESKFNEFEVKFFRSWSRLASRYAKEYGYAELWEMADKLVAKLSPKYPNKLLEDVRKVLGR